MNDDQNNFNNVPDNSLNNMQNQMNNMNVSNNENVVHNNLVENNVSQSNVEQAQMNNQVLQNDNNIQENPVSTNNNQVVSSTKNDILLYIFFGIVVIAVIACLLYMLGIVGPKSKKNDGEEQLTTQNNNQKESSKEENKTSEKGEDTEKETVDLTNTFTLDHLRMKLPDGYKVVVTSEAQDYVALMNDNGDLISFGLLDYMGLEKFSEVSLQNADLLNSGTAYTLDYSTPLFQSINGHSWLIYKGVYDTQALLVTVGNSYFNGSIVRVTIESKTNDEHMKLLETIDTNMHSLL